MKGLKRFAILIASTCARTNDVVMAKTSFIDDLVYESHEARDLRSGLHETHAALFYKVWERHEKNDHVSVNAFPFFTYDAGEKGSSGCSFLWRFFRYETEAGQNPKLDPLFIPLGR